MKTKIQKPMICSVANLILLGQLAHGKAALLSSKVNASDNSPKPRNTLPSLKKVRRIVSFCTETPEVGKLPVRKFQTLALMTYQLLSQNPEAKRIMDLPLFVSKPEDINLLNKRAPLKLVA